MEAKLKGLKVPELKALLNAANVSFDSKLTKPGLIKKILETPAAVVVASAPDDGAGVDDDLPDLPPSINWDDAPKATTEIATAASVQKANAAPAPQTKAPPPTPAAVAGTNTAQPQIAASPPKDGEGSGFKAADVPTLSAEDEIAKRKARAAKWGTTFIDPKTQTRPATKSAPTKKAVAVAAATTSPEDEEKRKQREARFGASTSKVTATVVDDEETRKRKAREERFGSNKKPRLEGEGQ